MSPQDPKPTTPPPAPKPPAGPDTGRPPAGPKTKSFTDAQLLFLFDALPVGLAAVLVAVVVTR